MQNDTTKTLALSTRTSASCVVHAGESGSDIAAGLRDLASGVDGLSSDELWKIFGTSVPMLRIFAVMHLP